MQRNDFIKTGLLLGTGLGIIKDLNASLYLNVSLKSVCIYDNYIRGYTHHQEVIEKNNWEEPLEPLFVRAFENNYDSFAIAVYVQAKKIGYIAAYQNISIARTLDEGVKIIPHVQKEYLDDSKNIAYFRPQQHIQLYTELVISKDELDGFGEKG